MLQNQRYFFLGLTFVFFLVVVYQLKHGRLMGWWKKITRDDRPVAYWSILMVQFIVVVLYALYCWFF